MKVTTSTHTESDDGRTQGARRKDLSLGELKLQQLDRRDLTFKGFILIIVIVSVLFNAVSAVQFLSETRNGRAANIVRQNAMTEHFDCVILLRKKFPDVNFDAFNYDDSLMFINKNCPTIKQ